MESIQSSRNLYSTVNVTTIDLVVDRILVVPPMTPTVSTSAPFGASNEGLPGTPCPLTAVNRLYSAAAVSNCLSMNMALVTWGVTGFALGQGSKNAWRC